MVMLVLGGATKITALYPKTLAKRITITNSLISTNGSDRRRVCEIVLFNYSPSTRVKIASEEH
jgi:hypothetical protein